MRVFQLASVLLLFLVAAVTASSDQEPPKDLVINTVHLPTECSVKAKPGDNIQVHYTGTLFSSGIKFDSSLDRGQPLPLILGVGQVIRGWDEGLIGMCVNEKRQLVIPSHKAYGSRGAGSLIPPDSALVFDVELVSVSSRAHQEL